MMSSVIQAPTANREDSHVVVVEEFQKETEKSISNKLKGIEEDKTQTVTIPKVHERLIYTDNDSYEPRIISIGPYHRGNKKLQDMEKHKWRYVQAILSRNESHGLMDYIHELKALEMKARDCYSTNSINKDDDFVEMMLLDGCFIVEFLLRLKEVKEDELSTIIWMVPQIQYDMLLLENQLPFFVLELIFDLVTTKEGQVNPTNSLMKLALNYVRKMFSAFARCSKLAVTPSKPVHHLLHLFYLCVSPKIKQSPDYSSNSSSIGFDWQSHAKASTKPISRISNENSKKIFKIPQKISILRGIFFQCSDSTPPKEIPCSTIGFVVESVETDEKGMVSMIQSASVLEEAGIKFEKKEHGGILDVEFDFEDGIMKIPPLLIDSFIMYQFRNLITFEQLCPGMRPFFTTYVLFLNYLVNTCKDVALLHGEGIIEHLLGSDKEVACLFNKLTRATFRPSHHYLCRMFSEVNEYCNERRHRWRAALVHNYFNTPWTVLSVVAAIILLAFTFVQTFFSVYSYARPPS